MSEVRKLSPDFLHPVTITEGDDFVRHLPELGPGDGKDFRLSSGFLKIVMVHEIGSDAIEHDQRGGNGLVAVRHALRQRQHENFEGDEPTLGQDVWVRPLAHDFFSFVPVEFLNVPGRPASVEGRPS